MPYEIVVHNGRQRMRFYDEGAVKIKHKDGLGCVFVAKRQKPKGEAITVHAYVGQSAKPAFAFYYYDAAKAEAKVRDFFAGLSARRARIKKARAESNAGHNFKVGDIITNSWGYDQTNVFFSRVTKASTNFVWLQPISGSVSSDELETPCPMAGYAVPHVDTSSPDMSKWSFTDLDDPVEKHKASGDWISMRYGAGKKWDGKAQYVSWYA